MVPLIMALRQETVRLLIADDVGVGKTIEALLIAFELYERREIRQFAIVCLPHLCDQWQEELKNKFGLEAVIIRSGTVTALERQLRAHENIFRAFPFQVISIDYIKSSNKRQVFIDHCPELVIVDEAHTCARPAGANLSQQQRHHLLHDIARKPRQHLILLTATPHSGKEEEFRSLLGLLNPEFLDFDILQSDEALKEKLVKHFIQRRRKDVTRWLDEQTRFPERNSTEISYNLGEEYKALFGEIIKYASDLAGRKHRDKRSQRYSYWEALALLRGVMSSPAAGATMLRKKAEKRWSMAEEPDDEFYFEYPGDDQELLDTDFSRNDNLPLSVMGKSGPVKSAESLQLLEFADRLEKLNTPEHDRKACKAIEKLKEFLDRGLHPVVFCRYIQTARYFGQLCQEAFPIKDYPGLCIKVITSEMNDELRRETIDDMMQSARRLLIATDCLSEGINLQEGFNAVLHYDLPWNPNRLEQREGRVDRFGQQSPTVEVALLCGSDNPIDGIVLEILIRKAREIHQSTGISIPLPEESNIVMEAITRALLLRPLISPRPASLQLSLFDRDFLMQMEIQEKKKQVASILEEARQREMDYRKAFDRQDIYPESIEADLKEVDEAIGNVKDVEHFVIETLGLLGVTVKTLRDGFRIFTENLPQRLKEYLTDKPEIQISFQSPTPAGYRYIGRNHPFTEQLSKFILHHALHRKDPHLPFAARAAVIRTTNVHQKTVIFLLRVRNVISEKISGHQVIAEETWLWGYSGDIRKNQFLHKEEALHLLMHTQPSANIGEEEKAEWLKEELQWITNENRNENTFHQIACDIALKRARHLVESHTRLRQYLNAAEYQVVEPVLPPDILGIYILLPDVTKQNVTGKP